MPQRVPSPLRFPRLLLCEGPEDKYFFRKLIQSRKLPEFDIQDTSSQHDRNGGNTKFGTKLKVLRDNRRGFSGLDHILIVSDNDTDQQTSFNAICEQLARNGFAVPSAILQRSNGRPTITIMMLPFADEHGNLESVCVDATRHENKTIASHADHFVALVKADEWPQEVKQKLWLRVVLSARYQKDPFIFLGKAFSEGLVPMTHNSFDHITDALRSFGS